MQSPITPDTERLYYCPQNGGYVSSSQACPQRATEPDIVFYPADQADKFTRPPFVTTLPGGSGTVSAPAQSSALFWLIGGAILLVMLSKDK